MPLPAPVTVTVNVPVLDELQLNVETPVDPAVEIDTLVGVKLQASPLEDGEAERLTGPVKLPTPVTVIVEVPVFPAVIDAGLLLIVKSAFDPGAAVIVTGNVTPCNRPPLFAST